jgi:hypothetical protein
MWILYCGQDTQNWLTATMKVWHHLSFQSLQKFEVNISSFVMAKSSYFIGQEEDYSHRLDR